jgi:hypothetical protein
LPPSSDTTTTTPTQRAELIRRELPPGGLFGNHDWRISPDAFPLSPEVAREIESLGRVLLQFNRAANLLYRLSVAGRQPEWVARWLDLGKPDWLIELQRSATLKNEWPRVLRPDLLLTEHGLAITELDSVPGGIGLTAWLNQTYSRIAKTAGASDVLGGGEGMLRGFEGIFGNAPQVHLVVSDESGTYRPEMQWLAQQLGSRFAIRDTEFTGFKPGDAVYRFFELFDVPNVRNAELIFRMARERQIQCTPPPRPIFEEKLLLALLWNRNLRGFWRQELGESFLQRLQKLTPYSWVVDPAPLPPHAAIPELNLTDWQQLKALSQRERDLILKVSGYSETAWGARGVYLGSDLPSSDWSAAVDRALKSFPESPYVLQRYHKPQTVPFQWFDFAEQKVQPMPGRVRLCPYYFVHGDGDAARAQLGGVLATVCPADKKIIHGMKEAVLAPAVLKTEWHDGHTG